MAPYVSFVIPLSDDSIYLYETFTEPSCRGLSIQAALCTHMMWCFGTKGLQRAVTGVVLEISRPAVSMGGVGFGPIK